MNYRLYTRPSIPPFHRHFTVVYRIFRRLRLIALTVNVTPMQFWVINHSNKMKTLLTVQLIHAVIHFAAHIHSVIHYIGHLVK